MVFFPSESVYCNLTSFGMEMMMGCILAPNGSSILVQLGDHGSVDC